MKTYNVYRAGEYLGSITVQEAGLRPDTYVRDIARARAEERYRCSDLVLIDESRLPRSLDSDG